MNQYDAKESPNAEQWLSLDENERMELVMNFHEQFDNDLPEIQAHSVLHVIVENQLALQDREVWAALQRLIRQGLERHDAVHAIGTVLAEDIFRLIKGEIKSDQDAWDHKRYRKRLQKLTAGRWLSGQH